MLIHHDPDEWQTEIRGETCPFHKANPGKSYAGCTCWSSIGQVRRSPQDTAAIKRARRVAEEELILAKADAIRARRKAERAASGTLLRENAKRSRAKPSGPTREAGDAQ